MHSEKLLEYSHQICVTGEFSGTTIDTLLMKECVVRTLKQKYNAVNGFIKIKDIEKIKVLTFSNNKFTFFRIEDWRLNTQKMKFKHFNIEDVLSADDTKEAVKYIGKKGYYADSLESFDCYIEDKEHIDYLYSVKKSNIFTYFVIGYSWGTCGFCNYFLPLEKVKKTEQTEKHRSPENRNTFDLWIANKVKVRVVTTALDYDNTSFSILGVIEKFEKQGILLK